MAGVKTTHGAAHARVRTSTGCRAGGAPLRPASGGCPGAGTGRRSTLAAATPAVLEPNHSSVPGPRMWRSPPPARWPHPREKGQGTRRRRLPRLSRPQQPTAEQAAERCSPAAGGHTAPRPGELRLHSGAARGAAPHGAPRWWAGRQALPREEHLQSLRRQPHARRWPRHHRQVATRRGRCRRGVATRPAALQLHPEQARRSVPQRLPTVRRRGGTLQPGMVRPWLALVMRRGPPIPEAGPPAESQPFADAVDDAMATRQHAQVVPSCRRQKCVPMRVEGEGEKGGKGPGHRQRAAHQGARRRGRATRCQATTCARVQ